MKNKNEHICKWMGPVLTGLLFCVFTVPSFSQPAPLVVLKENQLKDGIMYDAWVEFIDKDIRGEKQRKEILKKLEKEFNPRALARRKLKRTLPGLFDERDFPLAPRYLAGVAETGAALRVESRWLNGVTIRAGKDQIDKIKKLPFVQKVGDFHEHKPPKKIEKSKEPPKKKEKQEKKDFYGRSSVPVSQLGLEKLHKAGYTGKGITLAVIDAGFDLSHKAFNHPEHPLRIAAQWDFVENDGDIIPQPGLDPTYFAHGTAVLGTVAAYAPGELMGTAYNADFILCNAEDGDHEYYLEKRLFVAALEFAEAKGADVLTSSLVLYGGYPQEKVDGKTSVMTRGLNLATANGVICLAGAGNSGHDQDPAVSHLMCPGDGAQTIAVGAVTPNGAIASFSSDGPTRGGLLKPEVLALGLHTPTISIFDKDEYREGAGTSVATPVLAGAVACLMQVHPEWTVEQVRKALFKSGDYFRKHGKPDPMFIHGYGIPDVFIAAGLK